MGIVECGVRNRKESKLTAFRERPERVGFSLPNTASLQHAIIPARQSYCREMGHDSKVE